METLQSKAVETPENEELQNHGGGWNQRRSEGGMDPSGIRRCFRSCWMMGGWVFIKMQQEPVADEWSPHTLDRSLHHSSTASLFTRGFRPILCVRSTRACFYDVICIKACV